MNEDNAVLRTSHLTKYYGKQCGVEDISLEVRKGEVFGYLGPNGAGKTTTIRTLLDFIRPTRGAATIFGFDSRLGSVETRRRIGYLPGELSMYSNLTGDELLRYVASLRGGIDLSYAIELAKRMDCDLTRHLKTLSHGNRQKIGLVQAFMHKPQLIILDEPTIGLDPLMQQEFYRLIAEARTDGRTVFLSSHILPEVERVCDRVGIIREGKLAAVETVETLKSRALRRLEIHFARTVPQESFTSVSGVRDVMVRDSVLSCTVIGSLDALIKTAARFEVVNIVSHEPSLEEVFLTYYGGGKSHA
ncbi:MAG TPA: ABC transporter ATP-binding protein [Dehalococcoidales bacterium]